MVRAKAHISKSPAKRTSIRARLTALVLGSVTFSVVPVSTLFAINEATRHAQSRWNNIRTAADVLASSVVEAASMRDSQRAFAAIRAISRTPGIVYARVELQDGSILAENGSGSRLRNDVRLNAEHANPQMWALITTKTVEVEAPILAAGQKVGRILVVHTASNFAAGLLKSLGSVLGVALLSLLISLAISRRIQRAMTAPLADLTKSVTAIGQEGDFSRRVDVTSHDEVGTLVEGFNAMLAAIAQRDQKIEAQMRGLESEVAARTSDYVAARDAAENANAAKSDFLAAMSHEIRTPMNGVMVMAELLAAENLPPKANRHAQTIVKSGRNLLAVINDILDFSKIEAGKLEVEIGEIDVLDLIDDIVALFHPKAREAGVELIASAHPKAPRIVPADAVRLGQVVTNLVSNALKFTQNGYVILHLEPDTDPAFWRIIVQDTGIGIAEDKVSGIFAAFSQEDQTTARRFGGTGLGLSISKRLVEAMGGQIAVTSKKGVGTKLHVRLPALPGAATAAPPDLSALADRPSAALLVKARIEGGAIERRLSLAGVDVDDAPAPQNHLVIADQASRCDVVGKINPETLVLLADGDDLEAEAWVQNGQAAAILPRPLRHDSLDRLILCLREGLAFREDVSTTKTRRAFAAYPAARVLVVDDSEVNREVALEALSQFEIVADTANDGYEALSTTEAKTYDLVLMDGSMPVMDGYEATRRIRQRDGDANRPAIPIVALTAHVVGTSARAWEAAGMDGVLHKPFTLADLASLLRAHLPKALEQAPRQQQLPHEAEPAPAQSNASTPSLISSQLFDLAVMGPLVQGLKTGKAEFVTRVFGLYQRHAPEALEQLMAAFKDGDQDLIAKAAHALKSMSLNLGAHAVAKAASIIETAIRIEKRTTHLHEYEALSLALEQTLRALKHVLETGDAPIETTPTGTSDTQASALPHRPNQQASLSPQEQEIANELAVAIEDNGLTVVYQPLFDRTGKVIVSVEALVRWPRAGKQQIGPDKFIPVAEKAGLIGALGIAVRRQVFLETATWTRIRVAVNVSPLELSQEGFCSDLLGLLAATQFDPARLTLEVTETAFLGDPDRVRKLFATLRETGIRLALDDFGVGYSSLTSLHRFPFDTIKIDREFVRALDGDAVAAREALAIIQAVTSIGRALGREVVAEGVETPNQHLSLKAAGVHTLQGYLFGKPMTGHAFSALYPQALESSTKLVASAQR
jgi:EAL domain-containing protein (putative c-di-GMP-specific phosphodiesterase class I)/signal transduction histidine kinase/CheY-like chemotaxis protein/HPt (histidine-containing phosphotransfer) domain-containing protein